MIKEEKLVNLPNVSTYRNFSTARLSTGLFLFFPSIKHRKEDKRQRRLTILAVENANDMQVSGVAIGSGVYANLPRPVFESIQRSLHGRDLKERPIEFAFEFDAEGNLRRLCADDEPIGSHEQPQSDISQLGPMPSDIGKKTA